MKNLYLIGTLPPEQMKKYSEEIFAALTSHGITCLTPSFSDNAGEPTKELLFKSICDDVKRARQILFISQNETPDWGAMLGYAFALKKEIIILSEHDNLIPFMGARMSSKIIFVDNLEKIVEYIEKLVTEIKKPKKKN